MGQAKAKQDKAKEFEGMSFPEQVQHMASKVVKEAKELVDLGLAKWVRMEMSDDTILICLQFSSNVWELNGDKLTLKRGKNESDQTITTE